MRRKLFLGWLLSLFSVVAFSQVTTSNVRGLILDDQNEPLLGANIVAVHTPTGTKYGAATNEDGRFNILNMRIGGPYTITVSYVGFKDRVFNDVFLSLGQTYNVDVTLISDSQQLEEVIVSANQGGVFGRDRTGAETNVGRRELTRLPTISRSAQDFTRLEPTATGNSFGGRNDQFNNFSLDGSIFNNPFGLDAATPGGQTNAQPISLDAIDQIQVSLAPYDVKQAGFTGASVNAVTKSGTNDFKGTAYFFFRNQDFTGDKVDGDDIIVPDLEQTQVGFSIGGPIIKNKLFFFANFEKDDREDLGSNFVAATPENPFGSASNVSRVTAADLNSVSNALQTILGYDTGRFEGYTHQTRSVKGIFKLDWNINDNHRLTATYNFLDASRDLPANPFAIGRRGPDLITLQFENSGYEINNEINSILLELNSSFSGKYANKLQVGYTRFNDFRSPFSSPAPVININQDGVRAIVAGHEPFSINNKLEQQVIQITNNFNAFIGNHTITIGSSFERFNFDNSFNLGVYDPFGFVGGTFGPGYDSVASFLADINSAGGGDVGAAFANAQTVAAAGNFALAETNVGQWAFYAQDEWNLTDNFKLTYGLRMDLPLYFDTQDKIQENIDRKGGLFSDGGTYDPTIQYFDENGSPVFLNSLNLPAQKPLWSPRVGFNWDVHNDKTFQIRGGSGLFSGRLPFVWIGNQVANPDFFFYTTTSPDFEFPQVWRNSLGADYRFENGITVSTDIIYTRDVNAQIVRNFGAGTPTGTLNGGIDTRPIYLDSDRAVNGFGGATNAYVFTNTDIGRSFNWSTKVSRQFDNGLYASIAYNFLEARDASSIDAEISSDAFDRNPALGNVNRAISGPALFGDRHRIVGQLNKSFTYGGDKFGTTIGAFFEYAQGGRFSYTYSGDINNDGSFTNDLIYIPTTAEISLQQFEGNAAEQNAQRAALDAFISQDEYLNARRGTFAGRNEILSPWRGRWDIKILQDFNFTAFDGKRNTLQFSIDILNFGNLLNSKWGVIELPTNTQPIGVRVDAGTPIYSFDTAQTSTFTNDFSLASRWQAQFGLRYIFN
ncbi:TonB-dependent receptor [Leptobacterium flavescens]|uniref:TonB-dependent receptor n=1 Tax=Leptobacterium flavescens TaxID=472055 RepID=A0A6P0UF91_9FLAO|nr:TonB-dependent receptor [Leptobacterium flavescens]NER11944.1 TonB-dependent receptor [Leptobacterium flavescens]